MAWHASDQPKPGHNALHSEHHQPRFPLITHCHLPFSSPQERAAALKDVRVARNKGVARFHDRLNREQAKRQEDDRTKRLEALRNNDFEAYQELLKQQQVGVGAGCFFNG